MSEICIIVTIVVYLAAMLLVGFAYSKTMQKLERKMNR